MRSAVVFLLLAGSVMVLAEQRSQLRARTSTSAEAQAKAEMQMLVQERAMLTAQKSLLLAQMKTKNCSGVQMAGIVTDVSDTVSGGWALPGVGGFKGKESADGFHPEAIGDADESPESGVDPTVDYVGEEEDTEKTVAEADNVNSDAKDSDDVINGEATEGDHDETAFFMDGNRQRLIGVEEPKPKRNFNKSPIKHLKNRKKGKKTADDLLEQAQLLEQQAAQMQHHAKAHHGRKRHQSHEVKESVVGSMNILNLI